MSALGNLFEAARRAPGAVGDAFETVTKGEDPNDDVPSPAEIGESVRSIDDRLGPIAYEIKSLDEAAGQLRAELGTSREEIRALNESAKTLNESMARLSGEIEHLLDRVPGLSPKKARERAEKIQSEDGDDDGNE